MYDDNVVFKKSGAEIRAAIRGRCDALRARLEYRNRTLNELMDDRKKLRSYLVLGSEVRYDMHDGSGELRSQDDISSEEIQDMNQLCRRILEIEAELYQLNLIVSHMDEDAVFELTLAELVRYGFGPAA